MVQVETWRKDSLAHNGFGHSERGEENRNIRNNLISSYCFCSFFFDNR